jgi:hypothetical protein
MVRLNIPQTPKQNGSFSLEQLQFNLTSFKIKLLKNQQLSKSISYQVSVENKSLKRRKQT